MEHILTLNAGSSSLKFALFALHDDGAPQEVCRGNARESDGRLAFSTSEGGGAASDDRPYTPENALARVLDWLAARGENGRLRAVGHRLVHGGENFAGPARITKDVRASIGQVTVLAPLHQPFGLACVDALAVRYPDLPQVACFDTAFHRSQGALARLLPLPAELREPQLQRYGFHGLSYEFIARRLEALLDDDRRRRVIVAHLGSGASLCALRDGVSVDTTMGFSALDGLVMGTRPGALDAGVVLHLLRSGERSVDELEHALYHRAGLLGISGQSGDMAALLASNTREAALAVDYFVYRAAREIGAMASALGGVDTLVFTGGIGEHSPEIRQRIAGACAWMGVRLDLAANERNATELSSSDSTVCVLCIATDEELVIARHTAALLS